MSKIYIHEKLGLIKLQQTLLLQSERYRMD